VARIKRPEAVRRKQQTVASKQTAMSDWFEEGWVIIGAATLCVSEYLSLTARTWARRAVELRWRAMRRLEIIALAATGFGGRENKSRR
jgi:hypothetical protein